MYIISHNNKDIFNTDNYNSIWQKGSNITLSIPVTIKPGITEYPPFREDYISFANSENALEAFREIEDALCEGCRAIRIEEGFFEDFAYDGEPDVIVKKFM